MRPGDAGDTEDLSSRVLDAVELVEKIHGQKHLEGASHVKDLTGDKGFHSPRELGIIQEAAGLRTIIGDPNADRRQPTKPRARSPAGRGQCRPRREKQKRQSPAQKTRRTT